jgi:hypothetical protein
MKTGGCAKRSLRPRTGTGLRALNLRHWKTRLSTDQSRVSRSRFSSASAAAPLYRVLYLGENCQVAIYEVGALLGDPNAPLSSPKGSWVLMSLQITPYHVADLCDASQQKAHGPPSRERQPEDRTPSGRPPGRAHSRRGAAVSVRSPLVLRPRRRWPSRRRPGHRPARLRYRRYPRRLAR